MKNREKYAEEIIEIASRGHDVGVDIQTHRPKDCDDFNLCEECLLSYPLCNKCTENRVAWFNAEYKENAVISIRDLASLQSIQDQFKYIARDPDQTLHAYTNKPVIFSDGSYIINNGSKNADLSILKLSPPMVKTEDKEPWLIENLKKLKVVNEYFISDSRY